MNWLDLYNFLHKQANDIKVFGKFDWQKPVIVYDASTGDESKCDTVYISSKDSRKGERLVLITNLDPTFRS